MTPRDFSQVPVEQLARLLLERARHDPGLPRRSAANTNDPPPGWVAPPAAPACRPWFPERLDDASPVPGQDRLVDLVSQAVSVAQEAEDLAQATRAASRRASRGAAVAIALGLLGMVAGVSAGFTSLVHGTRRPELEAASAPVPPPPPAQPAASVGTAATSGSRAGVNAIPDEGAADAAPALAPATFVRVLPAVPSTPLPVVRGYRAVAAQGD